MGPKVLAWRVELQEENPPAVLLFRPSYGQFNVPATEEWNPEDFPKDITAGR